MKKMRKLLVGMVAFLVLALSMVVMPNKANAASSTKIYFQNTKGWSNVYCYIWQGTGPIEGTPAWPGEEMAKIEGTKDWYEIDYNNSSDFQVIFTDNEGNQTGNLPSEQVADQAPYWFVLSGDTTDEGTSDGLTPEGLSLEILRKAPEGFPAQDSAVETKKSADEPAANTTEKDTTPKTGDYTNPTIVLAISIIALCGIVVVVFKNKSRA